MLCTSLRILEELELKLSVCADARAASLLQFKVPLFSSMFAGVTDSTPSPIYTNFIKVQKL